MVFWNRRSGDEEFPEEESRPVSENEQVGPVEPVDPENAGTPSADADEVPEWVPEVEEVDIVIDGKTFTALSLFELPGPAVMMVQSANDAEKMIGVFGLLKMALPDDALARLEVLPFKELQDVLTSWSMASSQKRQEAYIKRGKSIIEELMRGRGQGGAENGRLG